MSNLLVMENKKRVAILVIVAIVLAITAVMLHFSKTEVSETSLVEGSRSDAGAGVIGLVISDPANVEDRGNPQATEGSE